MKNSENLSVGLTFIADWWNNNPPTYSVYLDDELMFTKTAEVKRQAWTVNFDKEVLFGPRVIRIRYENKSSRDALVLDDEPIRSNFITLLNLKINSLYCKQFIKEGIYTSDDAVSRPVSDTVVMLWQGEYQFRFNSPYAYYFLPKI